MLGAIEEGGGGTTSFLVDIFMKNTDFCLLFSPQNVSKFEAETSKF